MSPASRAPADARSAVDIRGLRTDMGAMKHANSKGGAGPSQRQLRAGELVRHALVEVLREEDIDDPALHGVSVTVSEVRMSPDLKHATVFAQPLGGEHAQEVAESQGREVGPDHHQHAGEAYAGSGPPAPAHALAEQRDREGGDQDRAGEQDRVGVGQRQHAEGGPGQEGAGGGEEGAERHQPPAAGEQRG